MHDIDTVRFELEADGEFDGETEFDLEEESPDFEAEEELLAAELLGVSSEEELDQFFGKLFKNISQKFNKAGSFLKVHGGPLTEALKGIAKSALPTLGAALGTAIPIPGVGTAVGGMLGNAASQLLEAEAEAEAESESPEDHEHEVARQFVRLAANTARHGTRFPLLRNRRAGAFRALRSALHHVRSERRAMSRLQARRRRRRQARRIYRGYGYGPRAYLDDGLDAVPFNVNDGLAVGVDPGGIGAGAADPGLVDAAADPHDAPPPPVPGDASPSPEHEGQDFEAYGPLGDSHSGRWVRRGRKIILYGV